MFGHLRFCAVAAVAICHAQSLCAQLRDGFEMPQPTWSLRQADCGVRLLAQERTFREARSGQSEHVSLALGQGTYVYLVQPIGRAPLIDEFRPSLFLKADRPSLQLMARVVFPRSIDRGTEQPISALLRGDMYTDVGQWQRLGLRDIRRLLAAETVALRRQFGSEVDPREAYVDMIAINAYAGEGIVNLWIDDLEIDGYVNLDETAGPQIARRPAPLGQADEAHEPPPSAASVQGSLVFVRGRPFTPRAVQHRGEPLEWLQALGFNTVRLSASPSAAELQQARKLGLWLIAPPPYSSDVPQGETYAPVIAWTLGSRLSDRDVGGTRELAREIRSADHEANRPLLVGADAALDEYSRLANLLLLERPALGTSHELATLRRWLAMRPRLARAGTPVLASVDVQRGSKLGEQLHLFGQGATWEDDVDPQQIRLQGYSAIAAGARGLVFSTEQPLAIDRGPAAMRTDALRLLNMELRLLEPWIAAGQPAEELAAGDGSVQVSVLTTDRSRLLIATQHAPAQQYVLGPPPQKSASVVVPGVGISSQAHQISLAGVKPLRISHTSGGARIALEDMPHATAVVITQDPLAMHHLHRTLAEFKGEAARLRYDLTARRLIKTIEVDQRLTELGHPFSPAAGWLREAHDNLEQARRLLESNDLENVHRLVDKAEVLLSQVRRGHWEQTAAAFPSPASSPCVAQFTTLPLHWRVAERIGRGAWGPNVQAAGDMESLDQMIAAGWQQQRLSPPNVNTEVSLSLAGPHSGRSALRLQAWPADPKQSAFMLERPPVWITSSPVPVRQGQLVRIHGWVHVPRPVAASDEGLLVFDSLGGPDLGDRVRLTQGWREFTLYRAVPETGDLTVTFALTGLGEASIDDLSVALLEPEPIRPQ
jgi:hypothetical protein